MKITLNNTLTPETIHYMSAQPLPADYECTQVPVAISEARKKIGIIGIFTIDIPYIGQFGFTVKALEHGDGFRLSIVSWDNDKYPVVKERMSAFSASLLKELHLAILEDDNFLNTVNEVKGAGTANFLAYKQNKRLSTTNILGDTTVDDNQAVI